MDVTGAPSRSMRPSARLSAHPASGGGQQGDRTLSLGDPLAGAPPGPAARERVGAAWRRGAAPPIGEFLGDDSAPVRSSLLYELVALELELRRAAGDLPDLDEYRLRFPGDGDLVAGVFGETAPGDPGAAGPPPAAGRPAWSAEASPRF